ncbi:MAG: hypothetical protein EA402_00790 [Planctomycetota bacterium]|nr:MAG: hypothetical protein EA402_00790 [Planctomycetota bacterium]
MEEDELVEVEMDDAPTWAHNEAMTGLIRMAWMGGSVARHEAIAAEAMHNHPGPSIDAQIERMAHMAGVAGFVHGDFIDSLAMQAQGSPETIQRALDRIAEAAQAAGRSPA